MPQHVEMMIASDLLSLTVFRFGCGGAGKYVYDDVWLEPCR